MKTKPALIPVMVASSVLLTGCPLFRDPTSSPVDQDSRLSYLSEEMRGRNATGAILGSIGYKVPDDPGPRSGYFQRVHVPKYDHLVVTRLATFELNDTAKQGLERLGVSAAQLGSAMARLSNGGTRKVVLRLIEVESSLSLQRELVALANSDPEVKALLKKKNASVVTAVGVLDNYEQKREVGGGLDVTAGQRVNAYEVKVDLGAQFQKISEMKISPETTIEYRLSKVCWITDNAFYLVVDRIGTDPCERPSAAAR